LRSGAAPAKANDKLGFPLVLVARRYRSSGCCWQIQLLSGAGMSNVPAARAVDFFQRWSPAIILAAPAGFALTAGNTGRRYILPVCYSGLEMIALSRACASPRLHPIWSTWPDEDTRAAYTALSNTVMFGCRLAGFSVWCELVWRGVVLASDGAGNRGTGDYWRLGGLIILLR